MGLDLYFYKSVKTDLRPIRDIEDEHFGEIPGKPNWHEDDLHICTEERIQQLSAVLPTYPVKENFYVWDKTLAKLGYNPEEYTWHGSGEVHEFRHLKTGQIIKFPDDQCIFEERDVPNLIVEKVFYDRIGYAMTVIQTKNEAGLEFNTDLIDVMDKAIGTNIYMIPEDFLNTVIAAVKEYSTGIALRWLNAYKEHKGKFDLVLVSY